MGSGSGGSYFGPSSLDDILRRIRESRGSLENEQFESDLASMIGERLSILNQRDTQLIRSILDEIKKTLGQEIEGTVELLFGGSVSKNTYVSGISDVDALVLLDRNIELSPQELKGQFADALIARYGPTNVSEGAMAVTLRLSNQEIQLLPAVRAGAHFKISSQDGSEWATIRPRKFAQVLSERNSAMSGKLVPMIKLAKAILASLPEQRQLSGYHIECIAVRAFEQYSGAKTHASMLRYFFSQAPSIVLKPMKDISGQSRAVDEYLGPENSLRRQVVRDALDRVSRRIVNADDGQSLDRWKELLNY